MVRQVSKSLTGSQELTPLSNPEMTQVVSNPIARRTAAPDNSLLNLVSSLSQVQPSLNRYLQGEKDKKDEENGLLGARDRMAQTDSAYVVPPEADPEYQKGYKKAHGALWAGEVSRQLETEFETHKNDPDFDAQAFVGKSVSENLAGIDDADILSTFLPKIAPAVEHFKAQHQAFQTEQIRENADGLILSQTRSIVEEGYKAGGISRDKLVELQNTGLTLNKSRTETNTMLLINAKTVGDEGHPEIYNVFLEPDEQGIAPVDNKEFGPKVYAAIQQAQNAYEAKMRAETSKSDLGVWTGYKTRLENEDTTLTVEEIFNVPATQLTEADKRTFIGETLSLQHKLQIRQTAGDDILSGNARMPSLPPEHQKVYQGEYDRIGQDMLSKAGDDPAARAQAVGEVITLGTRNGMTFTPMKNLLSSVDTTVQPGDKLGDVPQAVLDAATFYTAMKRVNPGAAFQYTTESSKTFLDVFDHAQQTGSTPQQAYAIAVRMSDPETKKQNQEFLGRNSKVILSAVEKELGKVEGSDVFWGFGKDKTRNIEAAKSFVLADMRNNPSVAYLGVEESTSNALAKFKATHVNDDNGHYLFVGLGGATPDFGAAVKLHVDGIKKSYLERTGQPAGDYFLQPVPGGGDTYQMWDALGPLPVAPVKRSDLLDTYRTNTSKLDLQTAQEKPEVQSFVQEVITSKKTDPALVKRMGEMDSKVDKLFKKGGMSNREYAQYQTNKVLQKAAVWTERMGRKLTSEDTPLVQGMGVDLPKVEMIGPKLSPKNGPSATDIAVRYQDSDPHFALTSLIEGLSLTVYQDPAGGRAIGTGYNIDKRGEAQARKDLKAAMVPSTVVDKLLSKDPRIAGAVSINPEQAARLYKKVQPEYEAIAKGPIGEAWDDLSDHQQAALTYLAYNTGQAYPKALAAIQKGDLQGAAKELTIHYTDAKTGQFKQNLRAMELVRSMFTNPNRFKAQLSHVRGGLLAQNPDNYATR